MPSKKPVIDDADKAVRKHVLNLLRGGAAHLTFDDVINSLTVNSRGKKVKGIPYTMWQLLEHMRLAQWDILEFTRDAKHISPEFPEGYWPKADAPPDDAAWNSSVKSFTKDLEAMQKLVEDSRTDLYARIAHGEGQTILREALLVADHNAYHLGQMVLLRRFLENGL